MSNWRNPLPEETDETGYVQFQQLRTDENGNIDTAGETFVRKLFNGTGPSVLYKILTPLEYNYIYRSDVAANWVAVDVNKEQQLALPALGPTTPTSPIQVAWNKGDYWLLRTNITRWYHTDDPEGSFSEELVTNSFSNYIPCVYEGDFYTNVSNVFSKWNTQTNEFDAVSTIDVPFQIHLDNSVSFDSNTVQGVFEWNGDFYAIAIGDVDDGGFFTDLAGISIWRSTDEGQNWSRTKAIIFSKEFSEPYRINYGTYSHVIVTIQDGRLVILVEMYDLDTEEVLSSHIIRTPPLDINQIDSEVDIIEFGDCFVEPIELIESAHQKDNIMCVAGAEWPDVFLFVFNGSSAFDLSSNLKSLYPDAEDEWLDVSAVIIDTNTILIYARIYDDNTDTTYYKLFELDLSDNSITEIDSTTDLSEAKRDIRPVKTSL